MPVKALLRRALVEPTRQWLEDRRPPRPHSIDWTIDTDDLVTRFRAALTEKHGHVFLCVRDLLPPALYRAAMAYWPLENQFEQRAHSRTRITMAWLDDAPIDQDARAFWHRFGHEVINTKVKGALIEVFRPYLARKFDFLPADQVTDIGKTISFVDHSNEGLNLDKGFGIGPHVDQHYIFVTSLFYMPAGRTQSHMGTMLFEPASSDLRTLDTRLVSPDAVREVHQFPFLPNTLCSFLQTPVSFHGLIGKSSPRARRSYQFNVHIDEQTRQRAYNGRLA